MTVASVLVVAGAVSSVLVTAVSGWQWHICNWGKTGSGKVAVLSM